MRYTAELRRYCRSKSRNMMLMSFLILAVPVSAEVTADPEVLVFHNATQSETVRLRTGDRSLPGSSVTSWRLLVGERNYSHMFRVTPLDDGLRVTPSDTVEIGSYVLALHTAHGTAQIQVYTPLSEHESLIESLAKRMDISVAEVRQQMGLSHRLGREQITLSLAPVHYWGQRLVIEMPAPKERVSIWKVNGEVVLQGEGMNRFEYVLDELGPLLLTYEERVDGTQMAAASALSEVTKYPAIPYQAKRNTTVRFQAPAGFMRYRWRLDGAAAGNDAEFSHRFDEPGQYTVSVLCEEPVEAGPYAMREDIYQVTVVED